MVLKFQAWFYACIHHFGKVIGMELIITCRYCDEKIDVFNISNHIKYHHAKGDIKH